MIRAVLLGALALPLMGLPAAAGDTTKAKGEQTPSPESALQEGLQEDGKTDASVMENAEGALPAGVNAAPQTSANPMQDKFPMKRGGQNDTATTATESDGALPEGHDAAPQINSNPATSD